jgi:hypothetical protein
MRRNLISSWPNQVSKLIDSSELDWHLGLVDTFDVIAHEMIILNAIERLRELVLRSFPLVNIEALPVSGEDLVFHLLEILLILCLSLRVKVNHFGYLELDREHL